MNWYLKHTFAGDLSAYLESLGVPQDVSQWVMSLPADQAQYYVNALRSNPQMGLANLQQIEQPQPKTNPNYSFEQDLAQRLPEESQRWVLYQFKQLRNSRLDYDESNLIPGDAGFHYPELNEYEAFQSVVGMWIRTNELADFLRANPTFDINSHNIREVVERISDWHEAVSSGGAGLVYEPTDPSNIVYGPNWENEAWNGWTIQRVTSSNDLLVEGREDKMNHCVGGYCEEVNRGSSVIFSLRDPNNEPHITIETDSDVKEFRQIQGRSNSEPKDEYKAMLREWISKLGPDVYRLNDDDDELVGGYDDIDDINEKLGGMTDGQLDEYGMPRQYGLEAKDMEYIVDHALEQHNKGYYRNDDTYLGDITNTPELFVDAYLKTNGLSLKSFRELEFFLSSYEDKNDFYDSWYGYEYWVDPPDEEDFEDETEYQEAYEEWERERDEAEGVAIDEARSKQLPWGFIDDMFKYLYKLKEEGIIPSRAENPEEKQIAASSQISRNWFKYAKLKEEIERDIYSLKQRYKRLAVYYKSLGDDDWESKSFLHNMLTLLRENIQIMQRKVINNRI